MDLSAQKGFSGGTVLVTGGARRLGRAIAETLAARGWRVLVHVRRPEDVPHASTGGSSAFRYVVQDLLLPEAADALFAAAVRLAPDLSAIVNNAAAFSLAEALPPDDTAALRRVNTEVPERLTACLAAYLTRAGRRGAVVDLLDARILAPRRAPDTPYTAAKRALAASIAARAHAFADVLRVNGVAPGPVLKPSSPRNAEPGGAILLPARPTPADVASAVAFLLDAPAVTGQILAVDAGQSLLATIACG